MKKFLTISTLIFLTSVAYLQAQTNRALLERTIWKRTDISKKDFGFYVKFESNICLSIFWMSDGSTVNNPARYILSKTRGTNTLSFEEQKSKDDDMGIFKILEVAENKISVFEILELTPNRLVLKKLIDSEKPDGYEGGWQPVIYIAVPEVGK